MSIWTRIKSALQPRVELSLTDPKGWQAASRTSDAGESVTETSAMALSAVWGCSTLICGNVASLPLEVRQKVDGRSEFAPDHPLQRILGVAPNADQTAFEFLEGAALALELWGNAYAERQIGSTGQLVGLTLLHPGRVTVFRRADGRLGYRWTTEAGKQREATEDEIVHLRGFGGHPLGGLSTLAFARNAFGLARAIDRSAGGMFQNGMRPSGTLMFKDFLTNEQYELAQERLGENYVGAMNTGKPMILEGGVEWKPITINPEDAQMLESRRFSVEEICRFFGVPPHMVGHTDTSTSWGTGLTEQTLRFQKFTLRPRLKRIETALERQLLTAADRAAGVSIKFNVEGLLRGDPKTRAEYYKAGLSSGWLTINEVRELEGRPPVAGGEMPRMQIQNVPITETGE